MSTASSTFAAGPGALEAFCRRQPLARRATRIRRGMLVLSVVLLAGAAALLVAIQRI